MCVCPVSEACKVYSEPFHHWLEVNFSLLLVFWEASSCL